MFSHGNHGPDGILFGDLLPAFIGSRPCLVTADHASKRDGGAGASRL
jgi:hypothetical protein